MEIPKIPDGEYRFADLVWEKKLTRQEAEELKRLIDAASMSDGRNDS